MRLEFGPNLASPDLLRLFTHPHEWADVRSLLSGFHLNLSHTRVSAGNYAYHDLRGASAFTKLRDWNLPLILEAGVLKNWAYQGAPAGYGCNGEVLRDQMREAVANVRAAGGEVAAIEFDEPLTANPSCHGQTFEDCARITATAVRELADLGVASHLIEAYPYLAADRIVGFVNAVNAEGPKLARFVWDLDRHGFGRQSWIARLLKRPYGLARSDVRDTLRLATLLLQAMGVEVEVIVIGGEAESAEAYRAHVLTFDALVRGIWSRDDLNVVTVRNWHGDPRVQPHNLPVSDPASHLGIVETVAHAWAA